jgi:hypothetical protein
LPPETELLAAGFPCQVWIPHLSLSHST